MLTKKIKLGSKVRDTVTGFEGTAICRTEWLNGCVQICIKPPVDKDGKMDDGQYIDIEQVEVVKDSKPRMVKPSGGPQADTPGDRRRMT